MLIGRESELALIDEMLDDAQRGKSSALVIRGDPGIGKSALLEHAVERGGASTVARALGVETESEFAYAGLHELVRPLLDRLEQLPDVQADALRGALALAPARGAGRLYIGAATLSLLAAAAGDGMLLCAVDDAHWLDEATAGALAFAARRLEAEGVVMLFAARGGGFSAPGIPELELSGLADDAGVALLQEYAETPVTPRVAMELVSATAGNPLALRELSSRLSSEQLRGLEPLPHLPPVGPGLETIYAGTVKSLSEDARRTLMIAATADTRAMRVISRTAGTDLVALEECEASGLLTIENGKVMFRHPLARSAVYHQATPNERRAAHRALADGFADDRKYAERRAWHSAAAAVEPDEAVAAQLEDAGTAASARRAHAAAAGSFELAAHLSPEGSAAARRLYLAARSARLAGELDRAVRLLGEAEAGADDAVLVADIAHLRARIELRRGSEGPERLVAEADRVEPYDAVRAGDMLATAADAAPTDERLALARRGHALAGDAGAAGLHATLVLARAEIDRGSPVVGHDLLAQARAVLVENRELRHDPELIVVAVETLATVGGGDDPLSRELLEEVIAAARAHAVVVLPRALVLSAWRHFESGNWVDASLEFFEAGRLAAQTGQSRERLDAAAGTGLLAALRGRAEELAAALEALAGETATATHLRGLAALGSMQIDEAIAALEAAIAAGDESRLRGVAQPRLDLVEAYVRAGRHDLAEQTASQLTGAEADWAGGVLGDDGALGVALAEFSERPFAAARLRLSRGEQRRRAGTRREARDELRSALALFEALDAEPWSERARRELRASGATARRRQPSTVDELTPQELQIARMVAGGSSQKEVAAALYLSPKTVEYHLGKIYRKLGISSGRQLRARLDAQNLLEAS